MNTKTQQMELNQELPSDFEDAVVTLTLTNSPEICLINFSDYEKCVKYNWQLRKGAVQSTMMCRGISLSRFICGKNSDHKDGNILNNCRNNLRQATRLQQNCNKRKYKGNFTSPFKGVNWFSREKKWMARISYNNKRYCLGLFDSEIEAAKAYDIKALELHGEFAVLNLPNTQHGNITTDTNETRTLHTP